MLTTGFMLGGNHNKTHLAGIVAQVVPVRSALYRNQHVKDIFWPCTNKALAPCNLDWAVQVRLYIHDVMI